MSDIWSAEVYKVLRAKEINTVATVPDGGLTTLLQLCESDLDTSVVTLSTEEEGIGILFGLWLGGQRGVLMMQSSGTGNCINALSLPASTRTPCLMLVTMRGQWGEFNPWQVPMGMAVQSRRSKQWASSATPSNRRRWSHRHFPPPPTWFSVEDSRQPC